MVRRRTEAKQGRDRATGGDSAATDRDGAMLTCDPISRGCRRLSGLVDPGCRCPSGRVERSPLPLRSGTCAADGSTNSPCRPRPRSRQRGPCVAGGEPTRSPWSRTGRPKEDGTRTRRSRRRASSPRRWGKDRQSIDPDFGRLVGARGGRHRRPSERVGRDGTPARPRCEPTGTRRALRSGPSARPGPRQACSSRVKGTSSVLFGRPAYAHQPAANGERRTGDSESPSSPSDVRCWRRPVDGSSGPAPGTTEERAAQDATGLESTAEPRPNGGRLRPTGPDPPRLAAIWLTSG